MAGDGADVQDRPDRGHGTARQIFSSFLFDELDLFDRFLRYGKMKGWTQPPPSYSEPAG